VDIRREGRRVRGGGLVMRGKRDEKWIETHLKLPIRLHPRVLVV
jgi:hypothetical protein